MNAPFRPRTQGNSATGTRQITVLLPSLNGATHLMAQLDSLARQTHLPARLIISDDGSQDDTRQLACDFARQAPFPVRVMDGPRQGVAANVVSLLMSAPPGPLALADQDDVWLPQRLEHGVAALAGLPADMPAIAAAARIVTDESLVPHQIAGYPHFAGFAPALVENPGAGNTILMNAAAAALARAAAGDADSWPPFHDWWLCQIVLGVGGVVMLDPRPSVYYRQHAHNVLGAGQGLIGKISRARRLFDGTYGGWLRQNSRLLLAQGHRMTPRNRAILERFASDLAQGRFKPGTDGISRASPTAALALRLAARLHCL